MEKKKLLTLVCLGPNQVGSPICLSCYSSIGRKIYQYFENYSVKTKPLNKRVEVLEKCVFSRKSKIKLTCKIKCQFVVTP